MKRSKICILSSFIIVVNSKTAIILAEVLFLMLKKACIDEFQTLSK